VHQVVCAQQKMPQLLCHAYNNWVLSIIMKKLHKAPKQQQGFTLLESLLALFVLSFGLLGVAGMHAQALQTGFVASQRMLAVSKAEEIIERIRSNRRGLDDYTRTPASRDCTVGLGAVSCSPREMAEDDLFIWRQEVSNVFDPITVATGVLVETLDDPNLDPTGALRIITVSIDWTAKDVAYNYTAIAEVGP